MKNTFTTCFRSKEFVGPPLTLPITSPVTPYSPGCQFTWSPATASRLVPRFHLAPGRLCSTWQPGGHTCLCSEPFSGASCRPESPAGPAQPARHRSDPLSSSSLPHSLRSSHPGLWGIPMPPRHTSGLLHLPHPRLTCSSHRYKYTSLHLPLQAVTQKSPPREAFPSTTEETSTPT